MNQYKLNNLSKKLVFIIGGQFNFQTKSEVENSLKEAVFLAKNLDLIPIGTKLQKRSTPHPSNFLGEGKNKELLELFQTQKPDLLFVDAQLTPTQEKNLANFFSMEIWDRTKIILKIFENNAKTIEAKMQVELATLEHLLPRLTRMWTHLDKERGGTRVSKGMGEKQINIDKNLIHKRVFILKKKIKKYHKCKRPTTQK